MRLKQILQSKVSEAKSLWLLVGSDRPTDRQCHLLSCPGQLKTILAKGRRQKKSYVFPKY